MAICILTFLLAISVKSQSCTRSIDSLKKDDRNALLLLAETPYQDTSFSLEKNTLPFLGEPSYQDPSFSYEVYDPPLLAKIPYQDTSFSFENQTIFNDKSLPKHV